MAQARRQPVARKRFHLLEDVRPTGDARVDERAGVIRNVKILGRKSRNEREYTAEAIRRAAHLYENISVRLNHPPNADDPRDSEDVLGWLRGVRVGEDGDLYGDLHCLLSHPMTPRLLEAAKRNPRLYGLSHNSDGSLEVVDGKAVVTEISEVRSVDLVPDPATTQGLFESVQKRKVSHTPTKHAGRSSGGRKVKGASMKITLREWFKRIPLLKPARRTIHTLMESGYMDPDAEMSVMEADDIEASAGAEPTSDPADMDPEAALKGGFRAALVAVLDDTTLTVPQKKKRLGDLLVACDKLTGQGVEIPEAEEPDMDADADPDADPTLMEEDCDDDDDDALVEAEGSITYPTGGSPDPVKSKKIAESKMSRAQLLKQMQYMRREQEARTLCETNGVKPTAALLESLALLDTQAKRTALLESVKMPHKARSSHWEPDAEKRARAEQREPKNSEEFVNLLFSAGN